jgi:hypothetical protein
LSKVPFGNFRVAVPTKLGGFFDEVEGKYKNGVDVELGGSMARQIKAKIIWSDLDATRSI